MDDESHKRRWYQFSLLTLLLVMTVSTVAFGGWVHYRQYRALQKQKEETAVWLQKRFGEHNGFFGPNPSRDQRFPERGLLGTMNGVLGRDSTGGVGWR